MLPAGAMWSIFARRNSRRRGEEERSAHAELGARFTMSAQTLALAASPIATRRRHVKRLARAVS